MIWTIIELEEDIMVLNNADMLSFWKKNSEQRAENPWFFFKIRFPMSTDVVNPGVKDPEMLTANLAVRLLLAPVAGQMFSYILH